MKKRSRNCARAETDPQADAQRRRSRQVGADGGQDADRRKPDRAPGDGKVFVMPVREAMRVRTGEHGDTALDETID